MIGITIKEFCLRESVKNFDVYATFLEVNLSLYQKLIDNKEFDRSYLRSPEELDKILDNFYQKACKRNELVKELGKVVSSFDKLKYEVDFNLYTPEVSKKYNAAVDQLKLFKVVTPVITSFIKTIEMFDAQARTLKDPSLNERIVNKYYDEFFTELEIMSNDPSKYDFSRFDRFKEYYDNQIFIWIGRRRNLEFMTKFDSVFYHKEDIIRKFNLIKEVDDIVDLDKYSYITPYERIFYVKSYKAKVEEIMNLKDVTLFSFTSLNIEQQINTHNKLYSIVDRDDIIYRFYSEHPKEDLEDTIREINNILLLLNCFNVTDTYREINSADKKHVVQFNALIKRIRNLNINSKFLNNCIHSLNIIDKKVLKCKGLVKNYAEIRLKYDNFVTAFDKMLKDPINYDFGFFNNYKDIYDNDDFTFISDEALKDFVFKYELVITNRTDIIEKYKIYQEYLSLTNLDDYKYIDYETKDDILEKFKEIKDRLNSFKLPFYECDEADLKAQFEEHNKAWVNKAIRDSLLDSINGHSLDEDQRLAVVKDEKNNLIIAGAGSGKTLTICGKVKYLIERCDVKPWNILLLSYSKKSADDLDKKVRQINKNLTVGTFHKIGLEILKDYSGENLDVESSMDHIINEYFREKVKENEEVQECVFKYLGLYFYDLDNQKVYENEGACYEDLGRDGIVTIKDQIKRLTDNKGNKLTFKREMVKSDEELAIANFYFMHGINYEYERPIEFKTGSRFKKPYKPAFYLTDYDLYHEHLRTNVSKNSKSYQFYKKRFDKRIEIHKKLNTKFFMTQTANFTGENKFDFLEKTLKNEGVVFHEKTSKEISDILEQIYDGINYKTLIKKVTTFINLYKARYTDSSYMEELLDTIKDPRDINFITICLAVYNYYMDYIRARNRIDFDDMILQATYAVEDLDKYKYEYIIVDEFQDISYSRASFLKALLDHGSSKLFAVGDDWQAIYRFSGCDLNIFVEFEKYFGYTMIQRISSTHRNSQELQDVVGSFIRRNPIQIDKTILSTKRLKDPVKLVTHRVINKSIIFEKILDDISKKDKKAKILVLGRNNFDLNSITSDNFGIGYDDKKELRIINSNYPDLNIRFSTVHSSKGLEEDFVILINCDNAKYGFPNKVEDDDIFRYVLSNEETFDYGEERRLFYVALTRTRSYVYLLVDKYNPSEFIEEIKDNCAILKLDKEEDIVKDTFAPCPKCEQGHVVIRKRESDGHLFYGCSNYPYCDYTHDIDLDDKLPDVNEKLQPICKIMRRADQTDFISHYLWHATHIDNLLSILKEGSLFARSYCENIPVDNLKVNQTTRGVMETNYSSRLVMYARLYLNPINNAVFNMAHQLNRDDFIFIAFDPNLIVEQDKPVLFSFGNAHNMKDQDFSWKEYNVNHRNSTKSVYVEDLNHDIAKIIYQRYRPGIPNDEKVLMKSEFLIYQGIDIKFIKYIYVKSEHAKTKILNAIKYLDCYNSFRDKILVKDIFNL